MSTSITWTDATGAATLVNGKPVPGDRFDNWEPVAKPIGAFDHGLGTGVRHAFAFRTDYGARFELSKIPASSMATMLRLQEHLIDGGTITVNTGDVNGASYATCTLAPDTEPEIVLSDRQMLEYTVRLSVINTAGSPVKMVCQYA